MVATAVIGEIGVTSKWARDQIVKQAEFELRATASSTPTTIDELRDGMVTQWKRFKECVRQDKLRPTTSGISAEKFFGDGLWKNSKEWGLKKGATLDGIVV